LIADTAIKDRLVQLGRRQSLSSLIFLAGAAALVLPTLFDVARFNWTTEQGSHGALVLASGLWLLLREKKSHPSDPSAASVPLAAAFITLCLLLFVAARITGIIEISALAMYGALLGGLYLLWGGRTLRLLWFPLFYLALSLPPPDSLVATITLPIKMAISKLAVDLLYWLGYPVASAGVTIQIAQFELLVAAACAGLNSIISLSAICLLYAYLRHHTNARYLLMLAIAVLPVAIFANFVRVLILILITYYFGEAAAQGFLHEFAGLLMFSVALLTMFALDEAALRLVNRRKARAAK
jgi:exosortase